MKTVAIVVAGGRGDRMKASIPKQFMLLQHREIFVRSVEIFHGSDLIDKVVLVMHPDWMEVAGRILNKYGIDSVNIIPGGEIRQESVYRGLCSIENEGFETVLIHDAARPLFSAFQIPDLLKMVENRLGVVVVEPLSIRYTSPTVARWWRSPIVQNSGLQKRRRSSDTKISLQLTVRQ